MSFPIQKNNESSSSQMRKGVLDFVVLLTIQKHGRLYASDILELLKKKKLIVVEGTLYPLLSRLKRDALLAYEWEESKGGPPRKYYTLTQAGEGALAQSLKAWKELHNTIQSLLK